MKKLLIIGLVLSAFASPALSKPEMENVDFYQERLTGGEKITLGVQFRDSEADMTYAVASLEAGGEEKDFTPLLDRDNDDFFAGDLGPVEGGQRYIVEIKGCNDEGLCTEKEFERKTYCNIGIFGSCIS